MFNFRITIAYAFFLLCTSSFPMSLAGNDEEVLATTKSDEAGNIIWMTISGSGIDKAYLENLKDYTSLEKLIVSDFGGDTAKLLGALRNVPAPSIEIQNGFIPIPDGVLREVSMNPALKSLMFSAADIVKVRRMIRELRPDLELKILPLPGLDRSLDF